MEDKIYQAFMRAQETGDEAAAVYFAKQLTRNVQQAPAPNSPESPNTLARIGRGMLDPFQGGKQIYLNATDPEKAEQYNKQVSDDLSLYEKGVGDEFDGGRMLGNVAATVPLMAARVPQTILGGMVQGAAIGGVAGSLMPTKKDDSRLLNAGVGVAGGAVMPPLIRGGANMASRGIANIKKLWGAPTRTATATSAINGINAEPQIKQNLTDAAKQQLSINGQTDDEALKRLANMQELGFVDNAAPMTGQITRSPKQWTTERNLAKVDDVGDEITGRLMNQNNRFMDIFDELQQQTGRSADDVVMSGESIVRAVNGRFQATQAAVGKLYKRAQQQYGNMDGINLQGFNSKLAELSDDASVDKIANSVARRLQRYGIYDDAGNPTGKTLTIDQAEGLRKFVNNLSDGNERSLMRVKGLIIDELDNDVFNAIGDDAYAGARKAARDRFSEFEQSIVAKITNGKLDGSSNNAINSIVSNHSYKDLQSLQSTLIRAKGGKEAWNNLRGEVIESLNMASTQNKGRDGGFSGAAFKRALDKIGKNKLQVLFPDQVDKLYKLSSAGIDMTYAPPFSAVNNSNTASTLFNIAGTGLKKIPILGDMAKTYAARSQAGEALSGLPVDPEIRRQMIAQMNKRLLESKVGQGLLGTSSAVPAITMNN